MSHFILLLVLLAGWSQATVVCSDCRPMSVQEGPGIGLALFPGYGSASARFLNGSVQDIGIIEGSDEYADAVKKWFNLTSSTTVYRDQLSFFQRIFQRPPKDFYHPSLPIGFEPIVDMVDALWKKVNSTIQIEHNIIYISIPDILRNDLLKHPVRPIAYSAGLEVVSLQYQSQTTLLALYGLESCPDEDAACEIYHDRRIQTVLHIHIDVRSLCLKSMIRDDWMFDPHLGGSRVKWDTWNLEHELQDFMDQEDLSYDLLALSGTEINNDEFQTVIKKLFTNSSWIIPQDYIRSQTEYTFAAAKGAAELARHRMCSGTEVCIPKYGCPISKHCRDHYIMSQDDMKEEL